MVERFWEPDPAREYEPFPGAAEPWTDDPDHPLHATAALTVRSWAQVERVDMAAYDAGAADAEKLALKVDKASWERALARGGGYWRGYREGLISLASQAQNYAEKSEKATPAERVAAIAAVRAWWPRWLEWRGL